MMIVFTTSAVPFEWQIAGYNWALIIPLSLCVGCHILMPVRRTYHIREDRVLTDVSLFFAALIDRPEPMVNDLLVLEG